MVDENMIVDTKMKGIVIKYEWHPCPGEKMGTCYIVENATGMVGRQKPSRRGGLDPPLGLIRIFFFFGIDEEDEKDVLSEQSSLSQNE